MDINSKISVLVLGVGGNVSQCIIKSLKNSGIPMKIFGACVSEYSKGLYMCDESYICPYANDEKFISWLVDFCNEHSIDIIFSGVEEVIVELAKNIDLINSNTKAIFISSSYEKILIGQDKYLQCQFLEKNGCNFPKYKLCNNTNDIKEFAKLIGFPIIAKPRKGKSSKDVYLYNSFDDIKNTNSLKDYVLEQYIGDVNDEFTIGCYVDKNSVLRELIIMKRKLHNGTTIWAKTVKNQIIRYECEKICKAFMPIGPFNIQLRLDKNGVPYCFEMNVRFSGTTSMRSHFGFMDVKAMILEYIFDKDISDCFNIKDGEAFRFDEEMYLINNTTEKMHKDGFIEDIRKFLYM